MVLVAGLPLSMSVHFPTFSAENAAVSLSIVALSL